MKFLVLGAALVAVPACRTTTASGPTDGDMSELESATSGTRVLSLSGASGTSAATVFEKMMVEQVIVSNGATKSRNGRVVISCIQKGGLPPGAQGFPGLMMTDCTARIALPIGAMGFPSPGFLKLEGAAAAEVYDALRTEPKKLEPTKYEKYVALSNGVFYCKKTAPSQETPPRFSCYAKGTVEADQGGGTQGGELLSLKGSTNSSASIIYNAVNLPATQAVGATTKSHSGRLEVYCTQKGALPPGAQGFPGVIKHECFASVPLPTGAQGFPAPAFMKIADKAAADFYSAFKPEEKWNAQGHYYEKQVSIQSGGKFVCVSRVTNPRSFECTVSAQ